MGEAQSHRFGASDDVDWVLFTAPVGTQLAIYTRDLGPGVDTRLRLYRSKSDGTLDAERGDSNFDPLYPLGSRIDYRVVAEDLKGPLYVEVTNLAGMGGCEMSYTLVLDGSLSPTAPTATPVPTPRVEIRSFSTNPGFLRAREVFELTLLLQNTGTAPATNVVVTIGATGNNNVFIPVDSTGIQSVSYLAPGQTVAVKQRLRYYNSDRVASGAQTLPVSIKCDGCVDYDPSLSLMVYPGDTITVPTRTLDLSPTEPNIIVRRSWTTRAGSVDYNPIPVVQGVAFETRGRAAQHRSG